MSLTFNEAFDKLMEKIPQCEPTPRRVYSKETQEIAQKIDQAFHDINSIFQGTLVNFIDSSVNYPDQNTTLLIKMPFKITPNINRNCKTGSVCVLKTDVHHPVVRSGYVIHDLIISMFKMDLKRAIASIGQVNFQSGKTGTLTMSLGEIIRENTRVPIFEIKTSGIESKLPLFRFALIFQFVNNLETYGGDGAQFCVLDQTHAENMRKNIKQAVRLLVQLNGNIPQICDAFTDIASGGSVIEMTLAALKHLISVSNNPERLSFVYNKLMHFKQSNSVDLAELMALFAVQ